MVIVAHGRVLDVEGRPVAAARVHLCRWSAPIPSLGRAVAPDSGDVVVETDAEGRYSFEADENSPNFRELQLAAFSLYAGWALSTVSLTCGTSQYSPFWTIER